MASVPVPEDDLPPRWPPQRRYRPLTVHAGARLAHEPQLKVDPDLLARLLGELVASARIPTLIISFTHLGIRPGIVLLGSQDTDEVRRTARERLRGRHVQELALEWDNDLAGSDKQALWGGHDGLVIREKLDRISVLAVGTAMLAIRGQCFVFRKEIWIFLLPPGINNGREGREFPTVAKLSSASLV